ncbi:MAG: hypothetical protein D6785_09160 [Planctomycetota bacterium]|nr:MAG: hypothetical protein D6785_09160 [Planctomycetota bacterium]
MWTIFSLFFLSFYPSLLWGQVNEKKMKRLEKKMKLMERELQRVKTQLQELQDKTSSSEELSSRLDEVEGGMEELSNQNNIKFIQENTLSILQRYFGNKIVNLTGYYDFEYNAEDGKRTNGFRQHHVALWIQRRIYDFNFFTEVEFEDSPFAEGKDSTTSGPVLFRGAIRIERAWGEYLFGDLFRIRMGIMLTPDYWNVNNFPTTTPSVLRPIHVRKILPRDFVGVSLYGDKENLAPGIGFGYNLWIANGPNPNEGHADSNDNKVVGAKLILHLPLQIFDKMDLAGIFYYGNRSNGDTDTIWHVELQAELLGVILMAEFARGHTRVDAPGTQNTKSYGGYALIGYTFFEKYTISLRGEILDLTKTFDLQRRVLISFRYRPIPQVSIKFDFYRHWDKTNGKPNYNGFAFSFAIFF